MLSKVAFIVSDIRRGFSAGDARRSKSGRKPDFKVQGYDEAPGIFGGSSLCQEGTTFNDQTEQD